MYDKVFQMGSFPLNLHQSIMSYGKILTCQVFSDRRSPRGESPPGLDQIDRVKLANCGLPSAVQAETSIETLSYVQHDNHLAMLRRTPVTQAAVQRLNSMGWREGASLEASLMFVGMMIITFL